ncbi:MAG: GGDEF domain-containing protein [Stagnimonas sp.]|nr:GGDEF domain-containing protein [Stagnimonas sp.]
MEFGRTPQDIEHNRRVFLIGFYAVVGSLILVPLGVISLVNARTFLGMVLIANSLFCILFMIYSRLTARVRGVSYLFSAQAGVLAVFLVMHGGVEGSGIYYAFPLALMMVMLGFTSLYSGLFLSFVFMGIVALGLYAPVPGVHEYSAVHRSRIIMGLSAFFMMSLISEWMRIQSYAAITNTTEKLSADANHDPLTQLLNRRGLEEGVGRMSGTDFPAVVSVLDIDHFKKINDEFGHDAGDAALLCLADCLRANMKGRDLICRWGGEEFVVLFRNTSLENARTVLRQISEEARSGSIRYGTQVFNTTFSAGVVQLRSRDAFHDSMNQADQLLYQAKQNGRDQIVSADMLKVV